MTGIGEKLKEARRAAKISQTELGNRVGMSQQAIAEIEAGRSKNTLKLVDIARVLEKPPGWFFGDGNATSVAQAPTHEETADLPSAAKIIEVDDIECARIPVYDVRFSAGFGAQNDTEEPLDHYVMTMSVLRRYTDAPVHRVMFLQVAGDSMEPLLYNRDWVLVDTTRTNLTSPAIYAIVCNGEGFLKHASQNIDTGAINLISHNPAYPPQTVSQPDRLRIIGRVVLSIHAH